MKYSIFILLAFLMQILTVSRAVGQGYYTMLLNNYEKEISFEKIGRGLCDIKEGILVTKEAYAAFGENTWSNYEVTFEAGVPREERIVNIWAGFRAKDRIDRYVLALRGGVQNDLLLSRLGYMGTDDFLALRPLDFKLTPGEFYRVRIQAVGNRIRVFLNEETLPRIDIIDKYASFAPQGKITLGGSWEMNNFRSLTVRSLDSEALAGVERDEYQSPSVNKEELRKKQRAGYAPVVVEDIQPERTIVSLDGDWLFKPDYELRDDQEAIVPGEDDADWNILRVPDFWNPLRIWLFGERYQTASKGTSDSYYQKEIDRCNAYTFDYRKTNIGWYRQWIDLPADIQGKNLTLHFDAVSKIAEVWINGQKAGQHVGMFGDFDVDASKLLKPGRNLITVKVLKKYKNHSEGADKIVSVAVSVEVTEKMLNDLPHGFFQDDPAGIWQPVSLIITDPVKIEDVFIKPNMHGSDFELTIKNNDQQTQTVSLGTEINPVSGDGYLYQGTSVKNMVLEPGEEKTVMYSIGDLTPNLWSPEDPNLYNFNFILTSNKTGKSLDRKVIRSGFKTFEIRDGYFYLNDNRYWLRGANQTAMPIAPNDTALAYRMSQLMHDGNINVTRTHTTPYTEIWMDASDEKGVGVSFEGTWPWLMIADSPIPDSSLLKIWREEFYSLIKKYRNHPSMLIWTINNEMNFYVSDRDKERAKEKMKIISDVVKGIREIDPTLPICYSSNYSRKQVESRFGKDFMATIDDGDIDDVHYYPNWYNNSIFADFKGQFQRHKYPGRPLISQELSTGYPDENGHATRFYTFVHQTPQAVIGDYAYAYNDPGYFLKTNAFITKEEAEVLRRTNPEAAGILHFSMATWFRNVYKAQDIEPFPTYYEIKKALQPVLVSAELWGRHFYAGTQLPTRICVVNDQVNGAALPAMVLEWSIVDQNGKSIAEGKSEVPAVSHYGRQWIEPQIDIPGMLPENKTDAKLVLKLYNGGQVISENDYTLLLANKNWVWDVSVSKEKSVAVVDDKGEIISLLGSLGIKYKKYSSVEQALKQKASAYVFSGLDTSNTTTEAGNEIRSAINKGKKVFFLGSNSVIPQIFPEYIRGVVKANPEIAVMTVPESPIFEGIDPLETRYFNDNKRETPTVSFGAFQINREPEVTALASSEEVHGYLEGDIDRRSRFLDRIKGFPIVSIEEARGGRAVLSTLLFEKGKTDPVAAKLFGNILRTLIED